MSRMVETVALAIEGAMFAPHEMPLSDDLHKKYIETARAAIRAMREPSEAQREAARDVINDFQDPTVYWRAMIDAALVSEMGADAMESAHQGAEEWRLRYTFVQGDGILQNLINEIARVLLADDRKDDKTREECDDSHREYLLHVARDAIAAMPKSKPAKERKRRAAKIAKGKAP